MPDTPKLSLYERLGEDKIERATYLFYDKVLADERVKHFFKGVDMKLLTHHQYMFLVSITGGPGKYSGRDLRDAHRKLVISHGLSDEHFDAIKEDLKLTLEELGVGYSTVEELMVAVESLRKDVLNR
jgi:hemoglobin